jgi:hypothetical protein
MHLAPFSNHSDKVMEAPSRYNWSPVPDPIRISQKGTEPQRKNLSASNIKAWLHLKILSIESRLERLF